MDSVDILRIVSLREELSNLRFANDLYTRREQHSVASELEFQRRQLRLKEIEHALRERKVDPDCC